MTGCACFDMIATEVHPVMYLHVFHLSHRYGLNKGFKKGFVYNSIHRAVAASAILELLKIHTTGIQLPMRKHADHDRPLR